MAITIGISEETWKELNNRKSAGDSFDKIIRELETKIDVLQDEIDQHNYATKIDFEMPL